MACNVQKIGPGKIAPTPLVATTYESYFLFIFSIFLWLRLDSAEQMDDNTCIRSNHTTKGNTMVFGINSLVSVNGESYRVEELREDCVFLSDKDGAEIQVNYEDIDLT